MYVRSNIFSKEMIDIAYTIWFSCRDFGGMSSCLPCEMLPILVTYFNLSSCSHTFFSNQAIIIVCVLNMRKQPCISREPWNWILGILGPGRWWDMSTWKWRIRLLLFRLIGEVLVGGWGGADCCDFRNLWEDHLEKGMASHSSFLAHG